VSKKQIDVCNYNFLIIFMRFKKCNIYYICVIVIGYSIKVTYVSDYILISRKFR